MTFFYVAMNPAEEYILDQPEPFRSILLHVQATILATVPSVEIQYKWRLPFFKVGKYPICYLNIPRGKAFVDVCFWPSANMSKYVHLMASDNRKVVRSLRYATLEEIDNDILIGALQEADALKEKGFYKD